jgi:hypothetical protein
MVRAAYPVIANGLAWRIIGAAGGSFFFTVVMERRAPILGNDLARDLLRAAFRACL